MTKNEIILNILTSKGMDKRCMSMKEVYDAPSYFAKQLGEAVDGKPTIFTVETKNLGRCYNQYRDVVINYSPDMEIHPSSNWGKVEPKEVTVIDGITVAEYLYAVDSSD